MSYLINFWGNVGTKSMLSISSNEKNRLENCVTTTTDIIVLI